jgi:uncharacterized protein
VPYFFDGHNLLGQTPGLSLRSPEDRRRLVSILASFCRDRRCRMTVFFDGEPPAGWPAAPSQIGGVRVLHSGRGNSADDLILETIRKSRAPADVTLVTSDRALYERGRHLGAKAILGHAFREMMARSPRGASPPADKPEKPSKEEVDYFLEAFGPEPPIDASRSRKRR